MPGLLTLFPRKTASTALVRAISRGLSEPAINRAAAAMPAGKFRFVAPLGRGQFSLADKVVGNVGGIQGLLARKMPTRAVPTPAVEYRPMQRITNQLNQQYAVPGQPPPIAPFVQVSPKGGFQQLATAQVTPPAELKRRLSDLHSGNVGPGGQIIDYGVEYGGDYLKGNKPPTVGSLLGYPILRPDKQVAVREDILGNIGQRGVPFKNISQQALGQSNNFIRKYWSTPGAAQTMLSPAQQAEAFRAHQWAMRFGSNRAKPRPAAATPQLVSTVVPPANRPPASPSAYFGSSALQPTPAATPLRGLMQPGLRAGLGLAGAGGVAGLASTMHSKPQTAVAPGPEPAKKLQLLTPALGLGAR